MKEPALIAGAASSDCFQRSLAENKKTVPKLHTFFVGNEPKSNLGLHPLTGAEQDN